MRRQVNYLMSGPAHLPYLAASLYSLRKHWQGDIHVHSYPESWDGVARICSDTRLDITARVYIPIYRGKNGQFVNKIVMMGMDKGCDVGLYLDADTLVMGNLDYLFDMGEQHGFAATQFNDWTTNHKIIQNRIARLLEMPGIPKGPVEKTLRSDVLSVNGGVFACIPQSKVLEVWHKQSMDALDIFICDETVLHTMPAQFPETEFTIVKGGKYNCSPKYQPKTLKDEDVKIWHFHGDSNVRPEKSQKGIDLWWPVYQECLRENIGGISEWKDICGNRKLLALEKQLETTK